MDGILRKIKIDRKNRDCPHSQINRGLSLFILFLLVFCFSIYADEWKVIKGEHFLVYYLDDKSFAKDVSRHAERYYKKIASDLGYPRYDKFWQWENRVKIYIYPTHEQFIVGAQIPRAWAQGVARYDKKEIISFRWNEGFLDSLLPHELTHLIFRDFVGYPASGGGIPLWIDEGVAQWQEKNKKKEAEKIVKVLIKRLEFIPIGQLTSMDIRNEDNPFLARNFYAQAISLIAFLVDEYGGRRFTEFCRNLRDGKSLNASLARVYGNSMKNIDELEKHWLKYYGG